MANKIEENELFDKIKYLLISARQRVFRNMNTTMVQTYFEIGRMIVEDEQKGEKRAEYGEKTLLNLGSMLTKEFGKGFSLTNLKQMKSFYLIYSKGQTLSDQSKISQTVSAKLKKSETLSRKFRLNWSLRELKRQFNSALYERLALGKDKEKIVELSTKGQIVKSPRDLIKDPYIFEFIGLKEDASYSENDIESNLINNLKNFLLELGKGFTFVARQQRISFGEQHFFIDIVFYNRLLKCFVIFDIKIGELTHQDLGQLQMYVNYYDREVKTNDENMSIGILLCADKNDAVVRMTLPESTNRLFASRYKLYLPTKKELIAQIKF
ncbi:MAG: hypothetical protein US23_C0012G0005 [candidate division WS6 bacterium GW2011_GWE1_36_69]|nr:MAG: hypothetical protein US23_C0012G0005 [candidate division WS6 bacterium GW2011_GWE1_36_69]